VAVYQGYLSPYFLVPLEVFYSASVLMAVNGIQVGIDPLGAVVDGRLVHLFFDLHHRPCFSTTPTNDLLLHLAGFQPFYPAQSGFWSERCPFWYLPLERLGRSYPVQILLTSLYHFVDLDSDLGLQVGQKPQSGHLVPTLCLRNLYSSRLTYLSLSALALGPNAFHDLRLGKKKSSAMVDCTPAPQEAEGWIDNWILKRKEEIVELASCSAQAPKKTLVADFEVSTFLFWQRKAPKVPSLVTCCVSKR
jgi:hypothetical protein